MLSPVFNTDTTQYVIWLPYETTSVKIRGTAADKKASVEVVGGDKLAAGQDNTVKVICTAENGDKKTYTVIVKRAAAHDGSVEELPDEPVVSEPVDTEPNTEVKSEGGIAWWWLIIVGVGALAIGVVGGFLVKDKIKKN